jgi:exosortase/archaeosortase family protein
MPKQQPDPGGAPSALERRPRFIVTVAVYALLVLVLSVVLLSDMVFDDLLRQLRIAVAHSSAGLLNLFGLPVVARGEIISGPGTSLIIVNECTGIDATILLVSAILVFPATSLQKLLGSVLAIGVMMVLNFVRVLTLVYVGNYHNAWLDVGHLYVWPVFVILAGVGTLIFWAERFAVARTT